jgi:hypothetical protein
MSTGYIGRRIGETIGCRKGNQVGLSHKTLFDRDFEAIGKPRAIQAMFRGRAERFKSIGRSMNSGSYLWLLPKLFFSCRIHLRAPVRAEKGKAIWQPY